MFLLLLHQLRPHLKLLTQSIVRNKSEKKKNLFQILRSCSPHPISRFKNRIVRADVVEKISSSFKRKNWVSQPKKYLWTRKWSFYLKILFVFMLFEKKTNLCHKIIQICCLLTATDCHCVELKLAHKKANNRSIQCHNGGPRTDLFDHWNNKADDWFSSKPCEFK